MKNWKLIIPTVGLSFCLTAGLEAADTSNNATLYQRLGGMPAIQAVVDDLVARILADSRVNHWFTHAASDPEHAAAYKAKLADLICQATGGPCKYTGMDMISAHKGRGVTNEAFNSVVEDLVATLDKFKVPEREKSQLLGMLGAMKPMVVQEPAQK